MSRKTKLSRKIRQTSSVTGRTAYIKLTGNPLGRDLLPGLSRRFWSSIRRRRPLVPRLSSTAKHGQARTSTRASFATGNPGTADVLVYGDVTISFSAMEVHRSGEVVALTRKEFQTLAYFLKNARRVISRDELLNQVWGYKCYPCTRTVDNHILRLRKKLEPEPALPKHLRTVHGVGYKFLP